MQGIKSEKLDSYRILLFLYSRKSNDAQKVIWYEGSTAIITQTNQNGIGNQKVIYEEKIHSDAWCLTLRSMKTSYNPHFLC